MYSVRKKVSAQDTFHSFQSGDRRRRPSDGHARSNPRPLPSPAHALGAVRMCGHAGAQRWASATTAFISSSVYCEALDHPFRKHPAGLAQILMTSGAIFDDLADLVLHGLDAGGHSLCLAVKANAEGFHRNGRR